MLALHRSFARPAMEKFIQRGNIALFKRRLAGTKDEADRAVIMKLLAEEEAKGEAVPPRP